ncbi:hypothetical protein GCM10009422_17550 [Brevundimonas kwangchunensis]|uniref:DUF3995 domain-containing protein n=1 Tax=Brevundimonas kwangchunensis TaxID=322163 RepID=A0ABN1GWW6_9CAUL
MTGVSQWACVAAGLWLIGLGVWMGLRPRQALAVLAAMGSSPPIHFGEMAVRAGVGAAIMGAASVSRAPLILTVFGAFLIVSACVLALLPRRWHSTYSRWWAARIPVTTVRLISPLSVIGGAVLIWAARPPWLS